MVKSIVWYLGFLALVASSCGVKIDRASNSSDLDIIQITKRNTNVFLLKKDRYSILIDAGYAKDSLSIEKAILEEGVDLSNLQYIILTHAHSDHAGSAAFFQKKYGSKVIGGAADAEALKSGKQGNLCPTSFFARLLKTAAKPDFPRVEVDLPVEEGSPLALTFWGMEIECLPGHTPGSLIIHTDDGLFVGDLIRGSFWNHDKPTRHYFMCDIVDNNDDVKNLVDRSDASTWYPGHFGPLSRRAVKDWISSK